jgi:hypothetical protein
MADVASSLKNWSSVPASNSPTSATTIGTGLAPNFQQIQATLRNELATRSSAVTAAATTDIGVKDEGTVLVSNAVSTIAITSFGTVSAGIKKLVTFTVTSGAVSITHNATSMILPGAVNVTVTTGMSLFAESLGSGNWKVHFIVSADGNVSPLQLVNQGYTAYTTAGTSSAFTVTASPAITSYSNARLAVTLNATPTGSPTINVNGLGAVNFKYYDFAGTKQFVTSAQALINQKADIWHDGTDFVLLNPLPVSITHRAISGLTMSTAGSSATMSIAAGQATDSTNALYLVLAASISKTTSAWAVGTAAGGLDTGAIANTTWYHFYLIRRPDTGVVDVVFSTNASTPTLPANYTQYRRIGSGLTNGSAQWTKFTQLGDTFAWTTPAISKSNTTVPITKELITLATPLGIQVRSNIQLLVVNSNSRLVRIYADADDDIAVTDDNATTNNSSASSRITVSKSINTNTSSQVAWRSDISTTGGYVQTLGWTDGRGKE